MLLLMMVVNDSPSSLRRFTNEPIGCFATAEAFVFVSAFLSGMLFRKRIEKNGFNAARSSTIHRAGRIYCAHLLTLAFASVIGSFLLSYFPGLKTLFEQYLKNPPAAIAASMGDRPSSIVVDRPQHVACLLLADRFIDAFNRNSPFSHKHRTVFL